MTRQEIIDQLKKQVEEIQPEAAKISLKLNNVDIFASMNKFKVNWDTGDIMDVSTGKIVNPQQ